MDVTMLLVPFEKLQRTKLRCPLYVRGQSLTAVSAKQLICDVSFMHHCGSGCKVVQQGRARQVERQRVEVASGAAVIHDSNNEVFLYNVFCLNN